jgi:very-short-patch-repair endonuclease
MSFALVSPHLPRLGWVAGGKVDKLELAMSKSDLERAFLFYVDALELPKPVREWRFHPDRRWRFDFAWVKRKVAVECEGGIWMQTKSGRSKGHAHPARFENDCKKYSTAAAMGWKVLRVTAGMLDRDALGFLDLLIRALQDGETRDELP